MTPFWMVVQKPRGDRQWSGPRRRHYTITAAKKEATRLFEKHRFPFVVLGVVEVVGEETTPKPERPERADLLPATEQA